MFTSIQVTTPPFPSLPQEIKFPKNKIASPPPPTTKSGFLRYIAQQQPSLPPPQSQASKDILLSNSFHLSPKNSCFLNKTNHLVTQQLFLLTIPADMCTAGSVRADQSFRNNCVNFQLQELVEPAETTGATSLFLLHTLQTITGASQRSQRNVQGETC